MHRFGSAGTLPAEQNSVVARERKTMQRDAPRGRHQDQPGPWRAVGEKSPPRGVPANRKVGDDPLNPAIAICDATNSPDANCGSTGGTPAVLVFTPTSAPAIAVDPTTPQYQVNWNTQAAGFVAGHTYRVHVTAGAGGARRELGFADVLLTTTPGQAKFLQTGDIIVLQDGRTLPIHVRIETGIACDCWSTRASLTYARALTAVGVANGLLYVVGGGASAGGHTDNVAATESYNPATNSWTTRAPMPTPRNALGVGVINGILYAVGGISTSGIEVGTVEAYDPTTDSWTTKAPMPTPRSALGVVVLGKGRREIEIGGLEGFLKVQWLEELKEGGWGYNLVPMVLPKCPKHSKNEADRFSRPLGDKSRRSGSTGKTFVDPVAEFQLVWFFKAVSSSDAGRRLSASLGGSAPRPSTPTRCGADGLAHAWAGRSRRYRSHPSRAARHERPGTHQCVG